MTKELSALMDDELEIHEESVLWADLKTNPALCRTWQDYKMIGDAIRSERNLDIDITERVMKDITGEPVVLAPGNLQRRSVANNFLAMAASIAGISIVGWMALMQIESQNHTPLLAAKQSDATVIGETATIPHGMQEYILAHQANTSGLYVHSGTEHIRTVSMSGKVK